MKTTIKTSTLEMAQTWIDAKSKGRYAMILVYMDITDGAIDLIFRTHKSTYWMVELRDSDEVDPFYGETSTLFRCGTISKRKYLKYKNSK